MGGEEGGREGRAREKEGGRKGGEKDSREPPSGRKGPDKRRALWKGLRGGLRGLRGHEPATSARVQAVCRAVKKAVRYI